jgi:branched-chain amino acid transport system substrate-binding protein
MKIIRLLAIFFLIAGNEAIAVPREVKIGVITDLTGPGAYFGTALQVGVRLAVSDINTTPGKITVVFEDSALKPVQGLSAAQKLINADQVEGLIVDFTPVTVAVAPLAAKQRKLMIYNAAARSVAEIYTNIFKSYIDYVAGCEAVARQFKAEGIKVLGVLRSQAEFGELCYQGVRKTSADLKVSPDLIYVEYRLGEPLDTQLLTLKRSGVEAIINPGFDGDNMNMLKAAQTLKYPARFATDDQDITPQTIAQFKEQLENSLLFGIAIQTADLEKRARTIPGYEKMQRPEPMALGYLEIKLLYAALSACNADDLECQVTALAAAPPHPELGFLSWKNRVAQFKTNVLRINGGKTEVVATFISD